MDHLKAAALASLIQTMPIGQFQNFSISLESITVHTAGCLTYVKDPAKNKLLQDDLASLGQLKEFIDSINEHTLV